MRQNGYEAHTMREVDDIVVFESHHRDGRVYVEYDKLLKFVERIEASKKGIELISKALEK